MSAWLVPFISSRGRWSLVSAKYTNWEVSWQRSRGVNSTHFGTSLSGLQFRRRVRWKHRRVSGRKISVRWVSVMSTPSSSHRSHDFSSCGFLYLCDVFVFRLVHFSRRARKWVLDLSSWATSLEFFLQCPRRPRIPRPAIDRLGSSVGPVVA